MKKEYVQEIIDFVERNISEQLTVDIIANHIGYSRYYLHRFFYIYTGQSIMTYVRNRKLSYALIDLQSDTPIVDIAFKYSFNSRKSFSRLFLNTLGNPPSSYRNNKITLKPKLNLYDIGGIFMLSYLSEPRVVNVKKLYALSHSVVSTEPEHDVIDYMTEYKLNNKVHVLTEVGFDIPVTEEQNQEGLRGYEYWLIVSEEDYKNMKIETVKKVAVPASKYLLITIEDPFANPFERIPNGWKKLSSVIESKYEINNIGIYGFEEKIVTIYNTNMNIYIPIK